MNISFFPNSIQKLNLILGSRRISFHKIQEASGVGDKDYPTKLYPVETQAVSHNTPHASSAQQPQSDLFRMAASIEVCFWNFSFVENNFPSMEGK